MTGHRDAHFTDAERPIGERFMPCRWRSTTSLLALDL